MTGCVGADLQYGREKELLGLAFVRGEQIQMISPNRFNHLSEPKIRFKLEANFLALATLSKIFEILHHFH